MIKDRVETLNLDDSAEKLNELIGKTSKPYIFFTREGDKRSKDYLKKLLACLDQNPDVPAAQGLLKANPKKIMSTMRRLKGKSSIVDASRRPSDVLIYPQGLVVRSSVLRESGVFFNPEFKFVRDEAFALQLASKCPQRWVDGTCTYKGAEMLDEANPNGLNTRASAWYWESTLPLYDLLKENDGELSAQNQFALTYLVSTRFRANFSDTSKDCFEGAEDSQRFIDQSSQVLKHVSNDVLFTKDPIGKLTRYDRYYFAMVRNDEKPLDVELVADDDDVSVRLADCNPPAEVYKLSYHAPKVQNLNLITEDGASYFKFDMRFTSVAKPAQYKFIARVTDDQGSHDAEFTPTQRFSAAIIYFDKEVIVNTSLVAKVPLSGRKTHQAIELLAVVDGKEYRVSFKYEDIWNARLVTTESDAPYWSIPGYIVRDREGVICMDPATRMDKIKQELSYWKYMKENDVPERFITLRKQYWLKRPFFKGKRIWIYYDKVFKAGDNADFAYSYAMKQNDGIERYYVLDPSSSDWNRLEKAGYKLLVPGTLKSDLYAMNAELLYVTHNPGLNRLGFRPWAENYIKTFFNPTCIRLFHGFPNNRNQTYNQTYQNYSGVVVCSEYERQLYLSPANEYTPEQIIPCSNPRYDELVPDNKRWLVFAPTWRPTLRGKVGTDHSSGYNPNFKDSRYFRMYNTVLTSEKFLETARRTGYKVKIFLHPRMAPQTHDFEENDVVQGLDSTKDMTYVEMMRQADLMVTDYSSVQYDFASMHKPVVYYHDPTLPYWRVVEFDYESLGFGEICKNPQELVDVLCDYMERDCQLSDKYEKRISDFFLKPNGTAAKELYEATRKILG